ncbi:hypothetical protein GGR92_002153 [Spirosoma lacussanchae]|uniref:hypothetical protein n=1 Tax=Spirosoma lacussanchae TaxID=1884249 RepID=UPI0011099F34|nr:hypothetical protein [Spirosoma lacussanchae]
MKNLSLLSTVWVLLCILLPLSCNTEINSLAPGKIKQGSAPVNLNGFTTLDDILTRNNAYARARDTTGFNFNTHGQVLLRHIKYYSATIDPLTYLPADQRAGFKAKFDAYQAKIKANHWTHDQIIDDLVAQKSYTQRQGQIIKEQQRSLLELLATQPDMQSAWDWFAQREKEIVQDNVLTPSEKSEVLNQRSTVKYGLLFRLEQAPASEGVSEPKARSTSACGFWAKLYCYVGTISGLSSTGNAIGGVEAIVKSGATILVKGSAIGAIIGAAYGTIQAFTSCQCDQQELAKCDAPTTVSFPYRCYVPGAGLRYTAIGYGTNGPTQFIWKISANDDLNNVIYENIGSGDYFDIPGNLITQNNVSTLGMRVTSQCHDTGVTESRQSDAFGWFDLSKLGKPYFTISGADNVSPGQYAMYGVAGSYENIEGSVTIKWEVIPSGYPNYSLSGTFSNGQTTITGGTFVGVQWSSNQGYGTIKVTITSYCDGGQISEVQYLNVRAQ